MYNVYKDQSICRLGKGGGKGETVVGNTNYVVALGLLNLASECNAKLRAYSWHERLSSYSNIADSVSRLGMGLVQKLPQSKDASAEATQALAQLCDQEWGW